MNRDLLFQILGGAFLLILAVELVLWHSFYF